MDKFYLESETNFSKSGDYYSQSKTTYTYDEKGNLTQETQDYQNDGIGDYITTYAYDEKGNLTQETQDYQNDGVGDRISSYTYDEQGNPTQESWENNYYRLNSSFIYSFTIYSYTYDEQGNIIESREDYNGDGVDDYITYSVYDQQGNEIEFREDEDVDGVIDYAIYYSYDEQGNETEKKIDYDADGTIDRIKSYIYDDRGNLVRRTYDNNADGLIDPSEDSVRTHEYIYDDNGKVTRDASFQDGVADDITTYTYDVHGNLIEEAEDYDADGIIDDQIVKTYIQVSLELSQEQEAANTSIRTNGGNENYTDGLGQEWLSNFGLSGGSSFVNSNEIAQTDDDLLYQSEYFGQNISYEQEVTNGSYDITLHFAEIYFNQAGKRVFDVYAEDQQILDNFDIYSEAGGKNIALEKTFTVGVSDGTLDLNFLAEMDNAKISAIEIKSSVI